MIDNTHAGAAFGGGFNFGNFNDWEFARSSSTPLADDFNSVTSSISGYSNGEFIGTPAPERLPWLPADDTSTDVAQVPDRLTVLQPGAEAPAATPATAPAAGSAAPGFEPRLLQPGEQIRGNLFFGGAGMQGGYIQDMVRAFSEQGMALTPVNPDKWSGGTLLDVAIGVDIYRDRRFPMPVLLDNFAQSGPQFNLLGYSYGSVAASQVALHYADGGTPIDNLVLMGSPLGDSLLGQLRSHPNIRRVQVLDLGLQGDPIHAGMSRPDLLMAVPTLMQQMPVSSGHFYYSAPGAEGRARRDALADFLHAQGWR